MKVVIITRDGDITGCMVGNDDMIEVAADSLKREDKNRLFLFHVMTPDSLNATREFVESQNVEYTKDE